MAPRRKRPRNLGLEATIPLGLANRRRAVFFAYATIPFRRLHSSRVSNGWLKERGREYADFQWQGGYADFSVSPAGLEPVKQYIATQPDHHRTLNFQDELRALLRQHAIEWDEKYVWD